MATSTKLKKGLEQFRSHSGTPAAGIARVGPDGLIESAVSGTIHRDSKEAVQIDDAWHLGSCTKSITALLIGRLVEMGKLDWERSVADLLADIESYPGWAETHHGWKDVTLAQLLQCRAGVPANPKPTEMLRLWNDSTPVESQRTARATVVLSSAPVSPGEFLYSNLSYVLAGAVIDRATDLTYEEALNEFVLEPLDITSAGFGPAPRVYGHSPRIRVGPFRRGPGTPKQPNNKRSDNPVLLNPAGRLHLTLADWATIIRVFLNDGSPLVEPETMKRLTTVASPDSMAMGWGNGSAVGGSIAMQGSNTMNSATAVINANQDEALLVVANDGRDSVLEMSAELARAALEL